MPEQPVYRTGQEGYDELWLSPLPLAQDSGVIGVAIAHDKNETVLSMVTGLSYSYIQFLKMFKVLMIVIGCLGFCIFLAVLYYFDSLSDIIYLFVGLFIVGPGFFVIFLGPFLLHARNKARNDLPIFFHRQRREVLLLRHNTGQGKTEYLTVPWEEVWASVSHRVQLNPYGGTIRGRLFIGAEDPQAPGQWWLKKTIITLNKAHSRAEWGQICRYMDADWRHFVPFEAGLDKNYERAATFWPPLPDFVEEWKKPLPESEWKQPSIRLRWYNAYLLACYERDISFLDLGNIGRDLGYPGDEIAAQELKDGKLYPHSYGEIRYPPLPVGRQPEPPLMQDQFIEEQDILTW